MLPLILGSAVGLSLGLTGGGGAIFAVPLLTYLLNVPPQSAVAISLMTVGVTALAGFIQRIRRGQVEFSTGLLFAAAGMISAPAGSALGRRIPETTMLTMFAVLMVAIAVRMWTKANSAINESAIFDQEATGPACRRSPEGRLTINTPCAMLLAVTGIATGVLTGLFGVGGGFIIVPALVVFSSMDMQRAIGTSLLIITLISSSGVAAHIASGAVLVSSTAVFFTTGSVAGLFAGSALSRRFAPATLQRIFAVAIVLVGVFVAIRTLNR